MSSEEVSFPGAEIGYEFEPLELLVTPELNQQYLYAEEDFNPIYLEQTEGGPPVVHPALVLNMSNDTRSPSFRMPEGIEGLHARDMVTFYSPARVGKKLIISWRIADLYAKRGRPYKVVEVLVKDEDGQIILKRMQHVTLLMKTKGAGGEK
jgi:hypothetical protein